MASKSAKKAVKKVAGRTTHPGGLVSVPHKPRGYALQVGKQTSSQGTTAAVGMQQTIHNDAIWAKYNSWKGWLKFDGPTVRVDDVVAALDEEMRSAQASCFWHAALRAFHDDPEYLPGLASAWALTLRNASRRCAGVLKPKDAVLHSMALNLLHPETVMVHDPVTGAIGKVGARGVLAVYLNDDCKYAPHWLPVRAVKWPKRQLTVVEKRSIVVGHMAGPKRDLIALDVAQVERMQRAAWMDLTPLRNLEQEAESALYGAFQECEDACSTVEHTILLYNEMCRRVWAAALAERYPTVYAKSEHQWDEEWALVLAQQYPTVYAKSEHDWEEEWLEVLRLEHPVVFATSEHTWEEEEALLREIDVWAGHRMGIEVEEDAEFVRLQNRLVELENNPIWGWRQTLEEVAQKDLSLAVERAWHWGKHYCAVLVDVAKCFMDDTCPDRLTYSEAYGRECPPEPTQLFAPEWHSCAGTEGVNAIQETKTWRSAVQSVANFCVGVDRHIFELSDVGILGREVEAGDLVYIRHRDSAFDARVTAQGGYPLQDVHSVVAEGATFTIEWFDCRQSHDIGKLVPVVTDVLHPFIPSRVRVLSLAMKALPSKPSLGALLPAMPSEVAAIRAVYAMTAPHLPVEVQAVYKGVLSEHIAQTSPAALNPDTVAAALVDVDAYLASLPARTPFQV